MCQRALEHCPCVCMYVLDYVCRSGVGGLERDEMDWLRVWVQDIECVMMLTGNAYVHITCVR